MRAPIMIATALVVAGTVASAQAPAFKRTVLQTVELSIPDRQAVTARAEFPGGASAGRHTHPGEEIGYLLEGSVSVEMDGVSKTLNPATPLPFQPARCTTPRILEPVRPRSCPRTSWKRASRSRRLRNRAVAGIRSRDLVE